MSGRPGCWSCATAGEGLSAARVQALPPRALIEGEEVQEQQFLDLEPLPEQVGRARDFVRGHASSWPEDDAETLVLLTSELVTNAVIHARTRVQLGVTATVTTVVISVHDLDLGRYELPSAVVRDGGRGLLLVEALSSAWAVHHHVGGGKTVWFRLQRSAPPNPGHDPSGHDSSGHDTATTTKGER